MADIGPGRYATVENDIAASVQFRVGWNNGSGPNQYTGYVYNILIGSSATIDLIDQFNSGLIVDGASCWVDVGIGVGSRESDGNFTFTSTAARALYKIEGSIFSWHLNGPYI